MHDPDENEVDRNADFPVSGAPLYLRIASLLEQSIRAGDRPIGSLLPPEAELAVQLGVSRQTLRQAISQLKAKGILTARKGVGTRIESTAERSQFKYSASSVTDLIELGKETELHIESKEYIKVTGSLAVSLGCKSGRRWLKLQGPRYHFGESRAFCWVEMYLDGQYGALLDNICVLRTSMYDLIQRGAGDQIIQIEQEIRPSIIREEVRAKLACKEDELALMVSRRFYGSGRRLIFTASTLLPEDRYSYSISISAEVSPP